MANHLCKCPITIEGYVESRSKEIGEQLNMDPELVPALVKNLRLAGFSKAGIAKQFGLETGARHNMGPSVTETRPARDWVACRYKHIAPLMAHSLVCPERITPQHVIAAFWHHGKAVAQKKDPKAYAPSNELTKRLLAQANRHGLSSLAEGLKIAMEYNRTRSL